MTKIEEEMRGLAEAITNKLSKKEFATFAALMRGYEMDCGDSRFEKAIRELLADRYPEVASAFDRAEDEGEGYPRIEDVEEGESK